MSLRYQAARRAGRLRERGKIGLRSALQRHNLDLVRHPYPLRVVRALNWLGVTSVLDVGANVGQYASLLRAGGFTGDIYSCEPLQDAFGQLSRRAGGDDRWTPIRTAVGDAVGSIDINVAANSFSSSVLPMTAAHEKAAPGSEFIGQERVPVTTVGELVARHGINPVQTLLKVDTQGYEGPVLDGAGDLLEQFTAVQLELSFVSLYDGQQLFAEMTERLAKAGFGIYALEAGFGDPRTGRMLQCDGLFVRAERLPDPGNLVGGQR